MNDDWQEAAFSNRHTHNRGQRGKGGKATSHGFNVQKTLGSYEIKSPKFPSKPDEDAKSARMEIYNLNNQGNALIGELFIPGYLNANLLMAGSRKVMKKVVRDLVEMHDESEESQPEDERNADETEAKQNDDNDEEEEEKEGDREESDQEDRKERRKAQEFEKNSFRSPKFWLKWQGQLLKEESEDEEVVTDGGYIVFSGNACEKFDGTLTCEKLGWKNIKVSGWKIKGMSARDFEIQWIAEKEEEN